MSFNVIASFYRPIYIDLFIPQDQETITLYTRDKKNDEFEYLGRIRSHYKKINAILFGIKLDTNKCRFMSISSDRFLVSQSVCH